MLPWKVPDTIVTDPVPELLRAYVLLVAPVNVAVPNATLPDDVLATPFPAPAVTVVVPNVRVPVPALATVVVA